MTEEEQTICFGNKIEKQVILKLITTSANAINFFKISDHILCPLPHQKKPLQIFLGDGEINKAVLLFHLNRKVVQNNLPKCNFATVRMFVTSVCSILSNSYAKHKF